MPIEDFFIQTSPSVTALRQRYDRLQAVFKLARAVARAETELGICQAALDSLREAAPGRRASILLFDADGVVRFKAWHGLSEEYRRAVEGHSPWRQDQGDATPFVVADVYTDTRLANYVALFQQEGIRSLSYLPLVLRGRVIGTFMVYGSVPGDPLGEDLPLAMNIADHVVIAIDRRRFEKDLLRERRLFTAGPVVVFRWRNESGWPVEYVSDNISQFGYTPEDFTSGRLPYAAVVHPDDLSRMLEDFARNVGDDATSFEREYRIRTGAGEYRSLFDYTVVVRDGSGQVTHLDGYVLDNTERRQLEQELLQAQKMESIGRLAGGVAHDFNNLLTVIIGAAEMALEKLPKHEEPYASIASIRTAADRAASLTAQLLAFARKQVISPRVIALNDVLVETHELLRRLIGEHIDLVTENAPDVGLVRVDPVQIQQILVNLALNARDAMPKGGRLSVRTAVAESEFDTSRAGDFRTDEGWVMLEVSDTGAGMNADTLSHLFEPFFTTKELGRGTGLGLATCYGIVRQSGGFITVQSELGRGTTFRVNLPRYAGSAVVGAKSRGEPSELPALKGGEQLTVLVAEDEPMVRDLIAHPLRAHGFNVITAANGIEALDVATRHNGLIDLLVSDLVMPKLGGRELAIQLRAARPEMRVLLVTGYSDDDCKGDGEAAYQLLPKPFDAATLLTAVANALRGRVRA
ncbi:MAG: ATP-binding protein [Planctomycetota bacterium]